MTRLPQLSVFASISSPNVSVAPIMYNAAFKSLGLNCVYVSFDVSDLRAAIGGLRALNIKGFSVSSPFKEQCLTLLDDIDPTARAIGAVNVVRNENGVLTGHNSDWIGAVRALEQHVVISGKRVAVVGAGGAGRAIAYGLKINGADVYLYNRTRTRAKQVSEELGVSFGGGFEDLTGLLAADIVVNATPAGSISTSDTDILPLNVIRSGQVILDAVVLPLNTKLILKAQTAGCVAVRGVEMFVYQGAAAFEHFTGAQAPVDEMFASLMAELTNI